MAVWQLVTRCLILGVGFGVKLSNEDTAKIEGLRDVSMATIFGTKSAIIGFVLTIATRRLVMEGDLSGRPTKCRILPIPCN